MCQPVLRVSPIVALTGAMPLVLSPQHNLQKDLRDNLTPELVETLRQVRMSTGPVVIAF